MHAKIKSLHIRRYRSIEDSSLLGCGDLNVLIGKNNAGKSNLLGTITLCLNHLRLGTVATPITSERPRDEFTDRDPSKSFQIGIEFELPPDLNEGLRQQLKKEAPQFDRPIDLIQNQDTLAFILTGYADNQAAFVFTEQIAVGTVRGDAEKLIIAGTFAEMPALTEVPSPSLTRGPRRV